MKSDGDTIWGLAPQYENPILKKRIWELEEALRRARPFIPSASIPSFDALLAQGPHGTPPPEVQPEPKKEEEKPAPKRRGRK